MTTIASQITSLTIVYSTVYSGAHQWKHQSSASLAFVRGIHRGTVNSPHKWPETRKMFPFDDVIMQWRDPEEWVNASHDYTRTSNIATAKRSINIMYISYGIHCIVRTNVFKQWKIRMDCQFSSTVYFDYTMFCALVLFIVVSNIIKERKLYPPRLVI